ncbi:hypothetical protein ACFSTE_02565 [Aquimarina hainanensis]|uniref:BppU N-terminal domain-containing protein n=1 Tax=Aquimarina hainanensis TaxID=1578017 RepID=A0ABW5N561_9FLAO
MKQRLSFFNQEDLPEEFNNSVKRKEKVVLISQGHHSSLVWYPTKKQEIFYIPYLTQYSNLTYGVRIIQQQGNLEPQQLDFEITIQGINNQDGIYCYHIDRKQVYINNNIPDTTVEELASMCGEVLYPVLIDFFDYTIKNSKQIKERWDTLKKKIYNSFQGEYVEKYITATEKVIQNEVILNRALKQDMFLALFTHIAETRAYDKNLTAEVLFNFPIIPFTTPIRYVGEQSVQKQYTPYNTIQVTYKGKITDDRGVAELRNKKRFSTQTSTEKIMPKGNCNLQYDLDRKTGMLKFCTAEITIDLDGDLRSNIITINELQS